MEDKRSWIIRLFDWVFDYKPNNATSRDKAVSRAKEFREEIRDKELKQHPNDRACSEHVPLAYSWPQPLE